MRLKGTMVIELTDAETGAVETITEENMVTNAVNNILGSSHGHHACLPAGKERKADSSDRF